MQGRSGTTSDELLDVLKIHQNLMDELKAAQELFYSHEPESMVKFNDALVRGQELLRKIILRLDMEHPLGGHLVSLYHYVYHKLLDVAFEKEPTALVEARRVLSTLTEILLD